jgi:hypothetical protein
MELFTRKRVYLRQAYYKLQLVLLQNTLSAVRGTRLIYVLFVFGCHFISLHKIWVVVFLLLCSELTSEAEFRSSVPRNGFYPRVGLSRKAGTVTASPVSHDVGLYSRMRAA